MSQYAPKFFPGQSITSTASADIAGGACLVVSGSGTVVESAAESASFVGVAVSTVKSGEPVAIYTQGVHRLIAAGGITAGQLVKTAANGKVAAATDVSTATAASTATATGSVDVSGEAQTDVPLDLDVDVATTVTVTDGDVSQAVIIGVALTTAIDGAEVLVRLK